MYELIASRVCVVNSCISSRRIKRLKGCQTLYSEKTERASHFHVCFRSNHSVSTTGIMCVSPLVNIPWAAFIASIL